MGHHSADLTGPTENSDGSGREQVSARSKADVERTQEGLRGFDWLPTPDEVWDRAAEVHDNGGYDMIAEMTGRPMEWVALAGTAHVTFPA
ncbi:hypothetical protein [Streptomyces fractus]|uniref:hypothetical protein n=1 Tax=Streptomyces fractus TaxID=641806 RepID=UPI003CEB4271